VAQVETEPCWLLRCSRIIIEGLDVEANQENALRDWETFEETLKKLRAEYGKKQSSPLLFRGQGNSEWPLATTLERSGQTRMLFLDFYRLICAGIGPRVETFTGVGVPAYDSKFCEKFLDPELLLPFSSFPPEPLYRYMIYLRHHGFPSPLLDWSYSPYVAAFFAFRDDPLTKPEERSIYAYCESPQGVKGGAVGEPTIRPIGPYVRSHRRHFLQQSDYTICGSWDASYGWRFDSHQHVFDNRRPKQDFLWKFNLPSSERIKVLRLLNDYNLNSFSLFDSEESLLETMWLQEQVLRKETRG
jgi:FRG domain-containing protein